MRIVVGVDGSQPSRVALELLRAVDWPPDTSVRIVGAGLSRAQDRRAQSEAIERAATDLRTARFATATSIVPGRPADALMAEAHGLDADLIVVGSRGLGATASALLGSVSAALVDQAPCPVLVARRPAVSRMLVATDGSRSAEAIPAVLLAWGAFKGAAVDVLSVRPGRQEPAIDPGMGIPWVLGGERRILDASHDVDRYRVIADEMATRLSRAGLRARPVVRTGDAAREIEEAAVGAGVDLIVTGSRGLGGLRRRLLGSVAHHVLLHSKSSVLVMRGHVPAPERLDEAAQAGIALA